VKAPAKVRRGAILLVAIAPLLLGVSGTSADGPAQASPPMTEHQKAEAFVRAIQESKTGADLDKRLKLIDPALQDRSWALPVLFRYVVSPGAKPEAWSALCRIDEWGDGAWHLEMKGTSFDGFAQSPKVFVDRYLSGDDCALLLILYAYRWTLDVHEVDGVGCTTEAAQESEHFDRMIKESHEAIISAREPATTAGRGRMQSLFQILATVEEAWAAEYREFQNSCEGAHE
jgi:hypothetical protein